MNITNLTISQLKSNYRSGDFTPRQLMTHLLEKARTLKQYNTWIELFSTQQIEPYLDCLENQDIDNLPLYGIPFAIKDNIDLASTPTTAACEAFRYQASESATVVQKLIDAGAIPLGKTNLDQFATGLVGTRSPYGATKNAFNPEYISGGSSSGSAVAVAQGLVSFSLGTDTAGSGRVPAAFNNILGMKPSRGLLSNHGVVPACKTLDCVALFATTTEDLELIFEQCAAFDEYDPYSRHNPPANTGLTSVNKVFSFAVPKDDQIKFFGNDDYQQLFTETVLQLETLGGEKRVIDFSPFIDAAALLYQGPWVTERYLACQAILDENPNALLEVTRKIIEPGKDFLTTTAFKIQYQLQAYKQKTDELITSVDFLLTPTTGTIYTIDEVDEDPIKLNSNLGYYTNYMNLLDYASIAVPGGITRNNLPFGVTLISTAFSDQRLLAYAQRLQQALGLSLGATKWPLPKHAVPKGGPKHSVDIVLCGAHMSGLPLNYQLTDRGAHLIRQCKSSTQYRLVALPGGPPHRPGMIRVTNDGNAIEVEVWRVPIAEIGSFLDDIPHPLGLGKVELEDGSWETGFICEAYAAETATDISHLGSWRTYLDNNS